MYGLGSHKIEIKQHCTFINTQSFRVYFFDHLIAVSFSTLGYVASCSVKFVVKTSKGRTGYLVVSTGRNILTKENC